MAFEPLEYFTTTIWSHNFDAGSCEAKLCSDSAGNVTDSPERLTDTAPSGYPRGASAAADAVLYAAPMSLSADRSAIKSPSRTYALTSSDFFLLLTRAYA